MEHKRANVLQPLFILFFFFLAFPLTNKYFGSWALFLDAYQTILLPQIFVRFAYTVCFSSVLCLLVRIPAKSFLRTASITFFAGLPLRLLIDILRHLLVNHFIEAPWISSLLYFSLEIAFVFLFCCCFFLGIQKRAFCKGERKKSILLLILFSIPVILYIGMLCSTYSQSLLWNKTRFTQYTGWLAASVNTLWGGDSYRAFALCVNIILFRFANYFLIIVLPSIVLAFTQSTSGTEKKETAAKVV